jgi:hypothetical protein
MQDSQDPAASPAVAPFFVCPSDQKLPCTLMSQSTRIIRVGHSEHQQWLSYPSKILQILPILCRRRGLSILS